jgi:hypothetical protein
MYQGVQLKSRLSILESDRPQHDGPAASVIAQQYSSAVSFGLVLSFPQVKIRRALDPIQRAMDHPSDCQPF